MTLVLFCAVLIAATLHALWNFAAKKVAGDLSTMWLGVCLAAVVSWPCAWLMYEAAASSPSVWMYVGATGILHVWYFALLTKPMRWARCLSCIQWRGALGSLARL